MLYRLYSTGICYATLIALKATAAICPSMKKTTLNIYIKIYDIESLSVMVDKITCTLTGLMKPTKLKVKLTEENFKMESKWAKKPKKQ